MMTDAERDILVARIDERTKGMTERLDEAIKRFDKLTEDVYDKDGLMDRMEATETKQKVNRQMITALWAVVATVGAALLYMFFAHVDATRDLKSALGLALTFINHLL